MFKLIYTPQDYYILHIDARHHYLHTRLQHLFYEKLKYPNVVFQKNRYTPIWGGVALLNTIKDAIFQALSDFSHWDYFLNLSFADYPINHREHLRLFLEMNMGKSFVKSHGREPEKFISKQGLNKLFYECENRMWRLGDREIPENMQLDGGSDWFVLHRNLCKYSVSSTIDDGVLREVNQWFNYTLLPAESYFHTVLRTSEMCTELVDNNLRVTNWNRARGCKCQYKHIVDWCGCSPNDFTPYDIGKVFKQKRAVFFARKFEESVSQMPLNKVHETIFGKYYNDDPAWDSYWENYWDSEFDMFYESDQEKTFKMRLLCQFAGRSFDDLKSVHIYKKLDQFKGMVLTFKNEVDSDSGSKQIYLERRKSSFEVEILKDQITNEDF